MIAVPPHPPSRRRAPQLALAALSTFLLVAGCAAMPGGALDGPEARGQRLARRQCSGCHAVGAIDLSPLAKAPPVRQLGARYDAAALERWVGEIARGGHGDMPFFQLGPTDAADLAAFIAASARR